MVPKAVCDEVVAMFEHALSYKKGLNGEAGEVDVNSDLIRKIIEKISQLSLNAANVAVEREQSGPNKRFPGTDFSLN